MVGVPRTYTSVKIHRTIHQKEKKLILQHNLRNQINTHTYIVYLYMCVCVHFTYTHTVCTVCLMHRKRSRTGLPACSPQITAHNYRRSMRRQTLVLEDKSAVFLSTGLRAVADFSFSWKDLLGGMTGVLVYTLVQAPFGEAVRCSK